jgi:hypothetical protein
MVLAQSGANVTQWTDMSGNGVNGIQAVSGSRPTPVTNTINGLPAIQFNGSNQNLNLPSGLSDFTSGASAFVVLKPAAVTAQTFFEFGTTPSTNDNILTFWNQASGNASWTTGNATTALTLPSATGVLGVGTTALIEVVQDSAGNATMYSNGTQVAQEALVAMPNISRTLNTIGSNSVAANSFFNGKIAEILVYNTPLSSSQRASVEAGQTLKCNSDTPDENIFEARNYQPIWGVDPGW